jgi:hypothetical protein
MLIQIIRIGPGPSATGSEAQISIGKRTGASGKPVRPAAGLDRLYMFPPDIIFKNRSM